jgi:asparagine synthetase B (glutamine-hydrolysing)
MFLFRVARKGIAGPIPLPSVEHHSFRQWIVTAARDEWLSSCAQGPDRVVVRETAPGGPLLAEAMFSMGEDGPTVELCKTLIAGRQVYFHLGSDGSLCCASHARLLRAAGVQLEEDAERLPEFYLYRYVTPPRTLFKGIDQLIAGQRLRFEFDGQRWVRKSDELYSPPRADPGPREVRQGTDRDYGVYGERNAAALRGAVKAIAPSPAPPHVLLSGGLDSSILFKLARDELGVGESYSTSYPFQSQLEAADIEREYALSAADALGSRHRFYAPTVEDFVRGVVEAVAAAEEPVVHLQSVLMLLLFRHGLPPGKGAVVVGQGADGAYGLRLHERIQRLQRRALRYEPWRRVLTFGPTLGALRLASMSVRRGTGLVEAMDMRWRPADPIDDPDHVLWWLGVTGNRRWVRRRFGASPHDANLTRAAAMRPYQGRSANDLVSLLDFIGDVSVTQSVWSKMGESAGKWVYYPFNDPAVLDAAFETPWDVKLAEPKGLLRGVARRVGVPEFIITRPKANFNATPKGWAVRGAVLQPLLPLAAKIFSNKDLRRTQSAKWPKAYTFWNMVNYALWKRMIIDAEPAEALLAELDGSLRRQNLSCPPAAEPAMVNPKGLSATTVGSAEA